MADNAKPSVHDVLAQRVAKGIADQTGVLGIPIDSGIPNVNALRAKGVYVAGQAYVNCDLELILYVDNSIAPKETGETCEESGAEVKLSKYDILPGTRVTATVTRTLDVSELYAKLPNSGEDTDKGAIRFSSVDDVLREARDQILAWIQECGFNVDCVFDRVWDLVIRQLCGGDCTRDCSFNCEWYDVDCHAKKIDCERLKGICQGCAVGLEWAKPVVKAYILALIGMPAAGARPGYGARRPNQADSTIEDGSAHSDCGCGCRGKKKKKRSRCSCN